MQEFSKYRVVTAGFILMFIFVIAAIYSNTKDIAEEKFQSKEMAEKSVIVSTVNNKNDVVNEGAVPVVSDSVDPNTENEIGNKILTLADRIDNLEKAVFSENQTSNNAGVRCNVKGIVNDEHFIPMSEEEAIKESQTNNKEVVITCLFK